MNVLFICLGNICRSPMAEGILKKMYHDFGIKATVESAGFESFHINDNPDPRAIQVAAKHNIDLSEKKARLFLKSDFDRFDHIYVMDTQNMGDVTDLVRSDSDLKKVDYLMNVIEPGSNKVISDPFLSGIEDCEKVFNTLWKACQQIAKNAKQNL
ncbi:MAG: low molecular weight phosphotyrosine protein phosphatase [Bacteroidetes bacterium]|nr:low molecular weight phosphotyrosine protein phosphatase [Bacteroidota bacterium]MBU1580029.1 low molecular weight phosphotyrosine protein phosphatase [Bacteroidota bacterium]MBU2559165.1 low molecular weight phosphotyrosine protein phosphatase [Bacteroidota bacterium]